jgi:hypothetical protein
MEAGPDDPCWLGQWARTSDRYLSSLAIAKREPSPIGSASNPLITVRQQCQNSMADKDG